MKILFSPQVRDLDRIEYKFKEDVIEATFRGVTDIFDFTEFGEGKLDRFDDETGEEIIETELEENPVLEAERKVGELYVTLINFIGLDATHEECFPEWIDHTEYIAPKPVEEEIVEEAVEEDVIEEEDSITIESPSEEDIEGWDDY